MLLFSPGYRKRADICLIFKEPGFFGAETERGYIGPYVQIADAVFQKIPVPRRVKYTFLFDLPYKCFGVAKTPLPKGWSQKVGTSCRIIDAEFSELPKKEEKINELEKYRVNMIDITGKEKPGYSDIIRFILKQRSSGCNGRT